jgi:group I intron endonuclease
LNTVYLLSDPKTEEPRYVGVTVNLKNRIRDHKKDKRKCYRTNWIQSLKKENLSPLVKVLEEVDDKDRDIAERFWIAFFRERFDNLVNATDGGDGALNPSPEVREKIASGHRGKKRPPFSEEWHRNLRAARKGRKPALGYIMSEDHKDKVRKAALGNQNALGNTYWLGKHHSEETKRLISLALTGRKRGLLSPETIQKMSDARREWWRKKKESGK